MENIAPLLVFVAFIILSLFNKKKSGQGVPQGNPNTNQKPVPRPVDIETVLEEFFGKKGEQPQYDEEGDLLESFDTEPVIMGEPAAFDKEGYNEQGYEFGSYETETFDENVFQDHVNKTSVGPDYQFGGDNFTFSGDQPLQKTLEEGRVLGVTEQGEISSTIEELEEFSVRDAVIYSEIINRKY